MITKLEIDRSASMFWNKENGRFRKAIVASISKKKFICPNCQSNIELSNVEFGEKIKCTVCGSYLSEKL
jgi:DNA-directed RNA polymerase subunit RPC12/RpoP